MTAAIIISAFMAYGILHLDTIDGFEGWRWLFFIEGLYTAVVGLLAYFFMPVSPTQIAGRLRGKKGGLQRGMIWKRSSSGLEKVKLMSLGAQ